jgi:hypothetical protein
MRFNSLLQPIPPDVDHVKIPFATLGYRFKSALIPRDMKGDSGACIRLEDHIEFAGTAAAQPADFMQQ